MSRSRFRSRFRQSSMHRTFGGSSGSTPVNGPAAIILSIGIIGFIASFAFNFVYLLTTDEFNIFFFLLPFGIMMVMIVTLMITSIIGAFKGQVSQTMGANVGGGFTQGVNILQMAQQAGFKITTLPNQDPSTAQGLIQSDKVTILIKLLPGFQPYQNGMVQDLSKGLAAYQAHEAWLIQNPATFIENDLNFARFYNVKLMNTEQALAALKTLTAPKPDVGQ